MPYYAPSGAIAPLVVESANVVAQRNGASGQTQYIYRTYTDASNYERFFITQSSGLFEVGTESAGTGAALTMYVGTRGNGSLIFQTNNGARWQMNATGHFLAQADNAYDIGASGATRPRTVYVGTSVVAPAAGYFKNTGVTVASLPAAGTAGAGARAFVTDASAPTFGSTVAGGGAVNVPVYSDGTNWKVG